MNEFVQNHSFVMYLVFAVFIVGVYVLSVYGMVHAGRAQRPVPRKRRGKQAASARTARGRRARTKPERATLHVGRVASRVRVQK